MARIGIDLGTTNTVVGLVYDDGPHVVPRGAGRIIPSVVALPGTDSEGVLVGESADNFQADGPVVRSVKRLMGRTYTEAKREESEKYFPESQGDVRLAKHGENGAGLDIMSPSGDSRFLWPEEICAHILREAKRHAETALGAAIQSAVVTVPAYFRDPHREATLDAARLAGLEVLGALLDEPTAAALAFAPHVGLGDGEPVLVADWGGGTLDVTVLMSAGTEWAQVNIDGHLTLGGDDVDTALVDLAITRSSLSRDVLLSPTNRRELRIAARALKESLSQRAEAFFLCPRLRDPENDRPLPPLTFSLSRKEFEDATRSLMKAALDRVDRCLAHKDVVRDAIRKVLLVGGSSQIPAFRRGLKELLPHGDQFQDVDPMKAVGLGAAIYANRPPEIARICPYGYAYLHDDESQTVVVPPGTEIPTPEISRFGVQAATAFQAQTVYRLKLVPFTERTDGRRSFFPESQRLFACELPPTEMGHRVDVEVWLDENKTVKAQCYIRGFEKPFPLEGGERGAEELFTRLHDHQLDAEALLAANPKAHGGLMADLKTAVGLANAARAAKDRGASQNAIERLLELQAQIEARREDAIGDALLPPAERARHRIEGWLSFYETEMVGRFLDILEPQQTEDIENAIRTLRLRLRTGASLDEITASFNQLERTLFSGPRKLVLDAWKLASVLGVPPQAASRLRAGATRLRDALRAEDEASVHGETAALEAELAQVQAAWKKWRETEALLEAGADLRVIKEGRASGN
jgi:molecular chaperone DnaK (HSP70)